MKMRSYLAAALLAFGVTAPAMAERLHFDHRLYPPLKAVFDNNRTEMIDYNDSNPKYIVDRIAIQGKSAESWTEAMDIIARTPSREIGTAEKWYAEIQAKARKACPSEFEVIARDANSITFSRRSANCGADKKQSALYRIVQGQRTLFMLNAMYRDEMPANARAQWLVLLASARLEN
jgi:hypothetical protein